MCIFKQIRGTPMGGNASSLIADLYLSRRGYCYTTKVVNTGNALESVLWYNCRYLEDISTVIWCEDSGSVIKKDLIKTTLDLAIKLTLDLAVKLTLIWRARRMHRTKIS